MTVVEILSKPDCHLCDVAKEVVINVQAKHPFEVREISMREGDEYFETYKERIPVIFINKEFAFQYKVSEQQFLTKLLEKEHALHS
ncbi:MAG: glutaredoxin family protein [Ignavibacteriae bacterium]|nr:glutaredoxin family protein [Ignavibacteriota bacterium]